MLDNYLYINRDECGSFLISADYAGNGLTGKHLIKIEY